MWGFASEVIMQSDETNTVLGSPGGLTNGSGDHGSREPKAEPIDPSDEPAWARRVRVVTRGQSNLALARRYWPVLVLIATLLGVGVFWLTIGRGPGKATLERQTLRTNFSQLQGQIQSLSVQVADLETAGERSKDKLTAANESIAEPDGKLAAMQARIEVAERRPTTGSPSSQHQSSPVRVQSAGTTGDHKAAVPAGPILVQRFRHVEIRLEKAVRDGALIRMDFVVTAAGKDTPLRIGNRGVRLNFADGTRHTRYAGISSNEWRRTALVEFALIADIPRRFTVEWADVRTQATEVAVVELSGDLRHSGTEYAMKFKGVTLE
jgi:hypothetical protein